MHLLLTDRLTCPRCGPAFGLILRADALEDRRISAGVLGCPNCREAYPIEGGVGDLRPRPRDPLPERATRASVDEGAGEILQALLGLGGDLTLTPGVAQVVLTEGVAEEAPALSARLDAIEVVVVGARGRPGGGAGWSTIVTTGALPFREAALRGVVLHGSEVDQWISEAARVVAPRSRIVVLAPGAGVGARLRRAGLELRLDAEEAVVAQRNPAAPTAFPGVAPHSGDR
ncbi:MAG: Trm112 family protein [Longimicrobiales bacterium]|nr:Trm112 family protein [Longimicrobiales bacterium]